MLRTIPMHANPQIVKAADEVMILLKDYGYTPHARDAVWKHIVATGTLEGSAIEREDMVDAENVFLESLPAVSLDSEAWDRDTAVTFDSELLWRNEHPWPIPAVSDDDRSFDAAMAAMEDLPAPIAGGAPRFEPTAEDLDWYRAQEEAKEAKESRWAEWCKRIEQFNEDRAD
jgi:hypothetical protein